MIRLENVSFFYGDNPVLTNINMEIPQGSLSLVTGINGAGKSTLLKCIAGIIKPREGYVYFDDQDLFMNYGDLRKYILYFPDTLNDYRYFSVYQFLVFSAQVNDMSKKEMEDSISFVSEKLSLEKIINKKISSLSRGLKQRAFLAAYIMDVFKKKVVIFDEAIFGLDSHACSLFCDLIKIIQNDGITILLTSHMLLKMNVSFDYILAVHDFSIDKISYSEDFNHMYEVSFSLPHEEVKDRVYEIIYNHPTVEDVVYRNNILSFRIKCNSSTWSKLSKNIRDLSIEDIQFSIV